LRGTYHVRQLGYDKEPPAIVMWLVKFGGCPGRRLRRAASSGAHGSMS